MLIYEAMTGRYSVTSSKAGAGFPARAARPAWAAAWAFSSRGCCVPGLWAWPSFLLHVRENESEAGYADDELRGEGPLLRPGHVRELHAHGLLQGFVERAGLGHRFDGRALQRGLFHRESLGGNREAWVAAPAATVRWRA